MLLRTFFKKERYILLEREKKVRKYIQLTSVMGFHLLAPPPHSKKHREKTNN
jgi:hypothetical protein